MLKVAQNFGEILADTIMPWTKYHSDTQDAIMKLAQRKSGITNLLDVENIEMSFLVPTDGSSSRRWELANELSLFGINFLFFLA